MPVFSRIKVTVEPEIYELVPVFMESLSSELAIMANCAEDRDYELMREMLHSSKGAALTFGFTVYAAELEVLHQHTLDRAEDEIRIVLIKLRKLLDNCVFIPAS
ncbi:Hpt domain-containing protein [Maridesulfovibrio sp.]|uniref:Hpt domain-containing protein n=1 Tax=Maridesulfovibrio sp. TaxID=2795000 RepID=UPI0029F4A9AD|nr:Hpt domain-containing protein [Maridesulfovibrio sp.]